MTPAYEYKATLLKVVDGDTVDLRVDVGFRHWQEDRFRLYGINAPEMNNPDGSGVAAKQFLTELLATATGPFLIKTFKNPEKYGRWLCIIIIPTAAGYVNVNDQMVSSGHAVPYMV